MPTPKKCDPKSLVEVEASERLTYDPDLVAPVAPSTTMTKVRVGRRVEAPTYHLASTMVHFRPTPDYDGEFGFSWYREGAMALHPHGDGMPPCNDHSFSEIMGCYYNRTLKDGKEIYHVVQDGNKHSDYFRIDARMYNDHRYDYHRLVMVEMGSYLYHIPYMTILMGVEAELGLHIYVRQRPDLLIIKFDNPEALKEGYFTINGASEQLEFAPPEVNVTDVEKMDNPDIDMKICVKSLREFSRPVRLQVFAVEGSVHELCGAVHILPNDRFYQRDVKVVLFNVETRIDGKFPKKGIVENSIVIEDALKKYLGQAYVVPEIITEDLSLVDGLGNADKGYLECCCKDSEGLYISLDKNKAGKLTDFLLDKASSLFEEKYENHYKIFFIGDACGGLNGFSSREKFSVCFGATSNPSSAMHELGHSMGLPHTFDASTTKATYTYMYGMTDNIMDYSHKYGVKRQSFFHWQWERLNIGNNFK